MRDGKWASPKHHRDQYAMFSPSLDDMIPAGHPIRLLEALLLVVDWGPWEAAYKGSRGRPPIHPRLVAGALLYGLTRKIRVSRHLEEATRVRLDFMWFLHGMTIDHSTFCAFRTQFEGELKDLFKQLAVIALKGEMDVELAVDGTRIRANSSRTGSLTAEAIERRAERIAGELSAALDRMKQLDLLEDTEVCSVEDLHKEIAALQAQQAKLTRALEQARERDEAKARKADRRRAESTRVPITDSDSHVLQNKEGGYAPNYTPTAAVDTHTGAILVADVPEGSDEAGVVGEAVAGTEELTGQLPERILFDSTFATGPNLDSLAQQGIEAYAPAGTPKEANPAVRPDPSVPVPAEQWDALPKQGKKKRVLTREAFVYDKEQNCYWCPMARRLPLHRRLKSSGLRGGVEVHEYMSESCADCPLVDCCLSRKAKRRRISRDQFETQREELHERMAADGAAEIYKRRAPAAEGVFGHIKHGMGVRRFLLRGLPKVRIEWLWITAAHNVSRILATGAGRLDVNQTGQKTVAIGAKPDHSEVLWLDWPESTVPLAA